MGGSARTSVPENMSTVSHKSLEKVHILTERSDDESAWHLRLDKRPS